MTAPTLIIRIGTDGVTAELGIDAGELACWPRDRYMELMDSLGRLNDVVSRPQDYDDGEPRVPLPTSGDLESMVVSVATAGTTSGPTAAQLEADAERRRQMAEVDAEAREHWDDPEWRAQKSAEMGAVVVENFAPTLPGGPASTAVDAVQAVIDDDGTVSAAQAAAREHGAALTFGPEEIPTVNLQLIRFLADNHGGFDDDAGFVARELADKLTWTQVVVNDTITACEGLGYVEVDRKGRRIHRVELTEAGRAVAAAHP